MGNYRLYCLGAFPRAVWKTSQARDAQVSGIAGVFTNG